MNLDVLIPSLLLPAPISTLIQAPHAPTLTRLLARADRQIEAPANGTAWLCERWGLTAPYPLAPLLAAFDGIVIDAHACVFKLLEGNFVKTPFDHFSLIDDGGRLQQLGKFCRRMQINKFGGRSFLKVTIFVLLHEQ